MLTQPTETIVLHGAHAAGGSGGICSMLGQERLRAELKKREKELVRSTQALTTAMTKYKAQHGKSLMFPGVLPYADVC